MLHLRRAVKYLRDRPTATMRFELERIPQSIVTWVDSDWAGEAIRRRSTSGGILTLGGALLASWSRTQKSVSLSSAEAEFYAIVTGATESIYIQTLLSELDYQVGIRIRTDSSAAAAFAQKPGLGKLKHIQLREAFLKDLVSEGIIVLEKVRGTANCSNVLTKPVQAAELEQDLAGVPTFEVGVQVEIHMVQVDSDLKDHQQAMTIVEAVHSEHHTRLATGHAWLFTVFAIAMTMIVMTCSTTAVWCCVWQNKMSRETSTRAVGVQGLVTYTGLRHNSCPRYQPLPEWAWGVYGKDGLKLSKG